MNDRVISAYGLSVMGKAAPDLVPTDLESAMFRTARGAIIRLTNGFAVAHPMSLHYSIVGTRGSAIILSAGGMTGKWWSEVGDRPKGWQDFGADLRQRPDGRSGLDAMLQEFVARVQNDTKPPIDVDKAMDMTLPGIVAHQSGLLGGAKLDVPDSRTW